MTLIAKQTVHRISFSEQFNAIFTADIMTLCFYCSHTPIVTNFPRLAELAMIFSAA